MRTSTIALVVVLAIVVILWLLTFFKVISF
jgi:hypothetical protein